MQITNILRKTNVFAVSWREKELNKYSLMIPAILTKKRVISSPISNSIINTPIDFRNQQQHQQFLTHLGCSLKVTKRLPLV